MSLDLAVSGALMRLHALERAVHDGGLWTISLGIHDVLASRDVSGDRVLFRAVIPEGDYPFPLAELRCDGETLLTKRVSVSPVERAPFMIDWEIRLTDAVVV